MKNTVKINGVSRKEMVKNYINVEFNNENYLVTTNAENKVRYISKCIPNKEFYRGYELEPVPTNSIKSVFNVTKAEFNETVEVFKALTPIFEEIDFIKEDCLLSDEEFNINEFEISITTYSNYTQIELFNCNYEPIVTIKVANNINQELITKILKENGLKVDIVEEPRTEIIELAQKTYLTNNPSDNGALPF